MVTAGRDGLDAAAQPRDIHRCMAFSGGVVAYLATAIPSPALDAAGVGQRTGVVFAGCDSLDAAAQTGHIHRRVTVGGGIAVAQLTEEIVSPALDAARFGQRTGVHIAGCDGLDAAAQIGHVHRHVAVGGRIAVSQLTVEIISPALDAAGVGQRTAVIGASVNDLDAAKGGRYGLRSREDALVRNGGRFRLSLRNCAWDVQR